jgi:hypothetical protein
MSRWQTCALTPKWPANTYVVASCFTRCFQGLIINSPTGSTRMKHVFNFRTVGSHAAVAGRVHAVSKLTAQVIVCRQQFDADYKPVMESRLFFETETVVSRDRAGTETWSNLSRDCLEPSQLSRELHITVTNPRYLILSGLVQSYSQLKVYALIPTLLP